MGAVWSLAVKDLRLLSRDLGGLFFALGFPLIMAVFFGTVFGGGGGGGGSDASPAVEVAVVDLDGSAGSALFAEEIGASADFEAVAAGSRDGALDAVRAGRVSAAVVLQPGFGAARERLFWGEPAGIEVVYDPSRGAERAMIEGMLTKLAFEGVADSFSEADAVLESNRQAMESIEQDQEIEPLAKGSLQQLIASVDRFYREGQESWMQDEGGAGQGVALEPISISTVSVRELVENAEAEEARDDPGSGYDVSFPQGVIWALIGVSAGFGISVVQERTSGTLRRLRVAPISRGDVLLGKGLACFLTTVGASALVLALGFVVFGVRATSYPLLALGVLSAGVCFTGIMMLLATVGKTEQAAAGIGWAVLLLLGMFGGAMVPLFIMPGWMQSLASYSPVKWAVLAIEGPLWRGFGAGEMLLPCGVLIGVGVLAFGVGAYLFGRVEEG